MKKILAFILAAFMLLAVVACTANTAPTDPKSDATDNNTDMPAVTMTAQEILDSLKKSLGSSWASDTAETEDRMSGYYGLDMSQIESWAAESDSMSSLNMDCAVSFRSRTATRKTRQSCCSRASNRFSAMPGCITWTCSAFCRRGCL